MNNKIRNTFFWRFSGGDVQYIEKSGKKSQRRFRLIGIAYLVIILITFLSFANAFSNIFNGLIMSVPAALMLTFLISNIYRLNILSLEPHTLPYVKSKGSILAAGITRIGIISIFAVFISKLFEIFLFDFFWHDKLMHLLDDQYHRGAEGGYFVAKVILLNNCYPVTWFVSVIMVGLFLFPIWIKSSLRRNKEYFNLKRKVEKQIVLEEYDKLKKEYNIRFSRIDVLMAKQKWRKIRFKERKYHDPPFNTKPRLIEDRKSQDEFMSQFRS